MGNEENKNINRFNIGTKDIVWTCRVFLLSVFFAFILAMIAYVLTFLFAEPEPVSEVIMSTASAATSKVEVTSNYINPMWAIFFFNSIAACCAVIGTGLFMMIHKLLIGDIAMRPKNRHYANISILMEKTMMPLYKILIRIASSLDPDMLQIKNENEEKEGTIWQYCGYGKYEYRMFSYMLPYTVPLLILIVNGMLMGILLAYFTFNGALTGFDLFGTRGILLGLFYNVVYFFISIIPHGIIEIPTILVAGAVGYHFAYIQAHEVIKNKLFTGDEIESLLRDSRYVFKTTKDYLLSTYTWKMVVLIIVALLLAAYIETYVTLGIVDKVMTTIDGSLEPFLA
ncbi:stage II sporulation protein M [Methanolobus sediminis]|uniref:Stage II sporulation protein M n=1 Tax=Methanolobus sediminis TaxID=3072978 RepID=A0AA51YHV6_9EURY|nr:stage II sporulation protein M [Methanolobus sediminis]WMW23846.1 stage II sporulation protein M [Methanolobus sediminis]